MPSKTTVKNRTEIFDHRFAGHHAKTVTMELEDLIIFDGICNFCSGAVRFIVNRDTKSRFRFMPMQTDLGQEILTQHNYDPEDTQTFLLLTAGCVLDKTDAAFEILKAFSWQWQPLRLLGVLPKSLRDWFYDQLATNRYRWFGKKEACMVPDDELKPRFINNDYPDK